jgi:threo-3-hydroxy-L-aspartate ammonia-lyase
MIEKILRARDILSDKAYKTAVVTSSSIDSLARGAKVFMKCENFQRVGAFKFRGAYNAIFQLTEEEKKRGVITYSSGNHAQAVALVSKLLGIKSVIVMPENSPSLKKEATISFGAKVRFYNPETETREEIAAELQREGNYTLIPPFNHEEVIAGQGTATLELIEEIGNLDFITTPCGGGGLLSGTAIAAKYLSPNCKVIGVEPELADDATKSFYTGKVHTVHNPKTIADGTRTASVGDITFPLIQKYVDEMVTVSEKEIIEAVKLLFFKCKLVVEPSGVLGLAAVINGKFNASGKIGVILSGGNIDGETMRFILSQ